MQAVCRDCTTKEARTIALDRMATPDKLRESHPELVEVEGVMQDFLTIWNGTDEEECGG